MSTVYKSAIVKSGLLPNAALVTDLFHVSQLANKMIGDVRRRVTFERCGRCGRAADLEYQIKRLLVSGQERLSERARNKLLVALADVGENGRQLGAAWRAREKLRDLTRRSPNQRGPAPNRAQIGAALAAFFGFCATAGASVPEIVTLAETISTWRAEICRAVATGHSNAPAEGVNRLIKLVYRFGFGFTNVANQQRRSRYVASRSTRLDRLSAGSRPQDAAPGDDPAAIPTPIARIPRPCPAQSVGEPEDPRSQNVTTDEPLSVAA
ncbi:transposase [Nonomuraea sp. NPDC049714]|uniref:transposase n=1 Tax=Nonomuraea sp. NPDC049714 TaxID=3364357 RepID=UPI0037B04F7C